KASKIRGEESNGMICSLHELGFEEKMIPDDFKDGIYYFDHPVEIGMPALEVLALDGWKMDLGLTPNRGDLLSVYGYALDLGSVTNQRVKTPVYNIKTSHTPNPFEIHIETKGCGRYLSRYIDQIKIKESPWWLKSALISNGIRPINNVVDISNYVLIVLGTPLHMFDAKKIGSKKIVVRDAKDKETVVTLDGMTRALENEDVLITNGLEAIAIGGVMGLENTMVDDNTTSILLEAAYFEPKRIQHTSKRLGLRSEASLRFERGIDDKRVELGLELATSLLIELADANVYEGISQAIDHVLEPVEIKMSHDYITQVLGCDIDEKTLLNYFKQYHYEVKVDKNQFVITPPSYRQDIKIPADVLEEIARIHGLDKILMKQDHVETIGFLTDIQKRERIIRHHLADLGLHEIISYTLRSDEDSQRYGILGNKVNLLMPLSEDRKVLRQSLLSGLLDSVKYNRARQMDKAHVFEIGHVFAQGIETNHLAIAMHGLWHELPWAKQAVKSDFYVLKGILEETFARFQVVLTYEQTQAYGFLHPYRQANIKYENEIIGFIGQLHPKEAKRLDLDQTFVLEIDLTKIMNHTFTNIYDPISKFPSISRDIAVVISETIEVDQMVKLIEQTVRKQLTSLKVFDVYQGSHIEKGMKSVAFSLNFNDTTKTLENDEVDKLMKKVVVRLDRELGAKVRS
ncbi:MAG: phenylalanine--tRNA ligase subunit beta, partial [Acholeplasmataceae bacterium]